jgi:hypothetical protein
MSQQDADRFHSGRNKSALSSKFEIQTYVAKGAAATADQPVHGRPAKPGAKS